jgi:hypothetical protein
MSVQDTMTFKLRRLPRDMTQQAEKAIGAALLAVLDDAQNVEPKPPIDTGLLRGSQFAQVGDIKFGNAAGLEAKADAGTVTGFVGFGASYAVYVHEGMRPGPGLTDGRVLTPGPKSQNAGGVGGLFLSLKLNRFRDRYARIVSDRLRRYLGGGQ